MPCIIVSAPASQPSWCATVITWPVHLSQESTESALAFLPLALP